MSKSDHNRYALKLLALDYGVLTFVMLLVIAWRYFLPKTADMMRHFEYMITGYMPGWMVQLYAAIWMMELMFATILWFHRRSHKRLERLSETDPVSLLLTVTKEQVFIELGVLFYLFLTKNFGRTSRAVIILLFLCNILFDYVAKLIARRRMIRHKAQRKGNVAVVLVTDETSAASAEQQLHAVMDENLTLRKTVFVDAKEQISSTDYPVACLWLPDRTSLETEAIASRLVDQGFHVLRILSSYGTPVTRDRTERKGTLQFESLSPMKRKLPILGTNYRICHVDQAALYIRSHIGDLTGQYLCFSNAHTTVLGYDDPTFQAVENGSAFTFPDGASIVRAMEKRGVIGAERVSGPDFMDAMFRMSMDGSVTHYFFGSTKETIELLEKELPKRYPGIVIKGMYSPAFGPQMEADDAVDTARINAAGADIVWIGLGAPRQEKWMAAHAGRIHGLMAGVGAGFNFYAGNIKRAPAWIQKLGLEWFYRLLQDPKHLFKRYFVTNAKFLRYDRRERRDLSKKARGSAAD